MDAVQEAAAPRWGNRDRELESRIVDYFRGMGLTRRQAEVLVHAVQGRTNQVIAQLLSIGERTVESHSSAALARLGVSNRLEACFLLVRELAGRP